MDFLSFSCLVALVTTSSTMLNRNGESGHSGLVFDIRGKVFNLSPLSLMLAMGILLIRTLILSMFLTYPIC